MDNIQKLKSIRNRLQEDDRELELEHHHLKKLTFTPAEYEVVKDLLKGAKVILTDRGFSAEVDMLDNVIENVTKIIEK